MVIKKKGASDEQNKWVMAVYHECGDDLEAVLMVEGESGFVLNARNRNKNGSVDLGLFQLNSQFNGKFIHSPQFKDPYAQIKYGCSKWKSTKHLGARKSPWYAYRNIGTNPTAHANILKNFIIL